MTPLDYRSTSIPESYKCAGCGATGCKLWRQYQTFAEHIFLLCAPCAVKNQNFGGASGSTDVIDEDGKHLDSTGAHSDSIGWLVPAVPTEEGDTYWGYTSVPWRGVAWWRKLPTLPSTQEVQ